MMIFDYVLLAVLAYFALWGFRKGLIRAVGSFVGMVLSVVLASRYFDAVAEWLAPYTGLTNNINLARIVSFILLLVVVNRLVVFGFGILEKMYKSIAVLPLMKLGNRVLGAILGLVEGAIVLGLVIYFISRFPFGSIVESFLDGSVVAPIVLSISSIVLPLVPEAIRQIQGLL